MPSYGADPPSVPIHGPLGADAAGVSLTDGKVVLITVDSVVPWEAKPAAVVDRNSVNRSAWPWVSVPWTEAIVSNWPLGGFPDPPPDPDPDIIRRGERSRRNRAFRRVPDRVRVPDFEGMLVGAALGQADRAGVNLAIAAQPVPLPELASSGRWSVADQDPAAGSTRYRDDTVVIYLRHDGGGEAGDREPRNPLPRRHSGHGLHPEPPPPLHRPPGVSSEPPIDISRSEPRSEH